MKTLLLFIGTVLRSRIIQRKGLGAIPAIYRLIQYWWTWTLPQSDQQEQPSGSGAAERFESQFGALRREQSVAVG